MEISRVKIVLMSYCFSITILKKRRFCTYTKLIIKDNNGKIKIRPRVVTSQQELAKSRSKSYIDGGIKAIKATGIEDRIITTLSGNPSSILP